MARTMRTEALRVLAFIGIFSASVAKAADQIAVLTEISINTPILKLLENKQAREIINEHLPNLVMALDEDFDAMDFFGSSSLRELSIDDDHVLGFDDELLAILEEKLRDLSQQL